ncbi:MAG: urease subunit beta [Nitrospira sp.]
MKKTSKNAAKKSPSKPTSTMRSSKTPKLAPVIPGEIIPGEGDIIALHGRQTIALTVSNIGDRPIQVGSHCHFFEANRALKFDREQSYGFRLQVPAGTAVRFEPGESKRVTLVALGGNRIAYGINGLVNGKLDDAAVKQKAFQTAREQGFAWKNT